jgi:hypothetical protein
VPQIRLPKPSDYDKLSRPADAGAPGESPGNTVQSSEHVLTFSMESFAIPIKEMHSKLLLSSI